MAKKSKDKPASPSKFLISIVATLLVITDTVFLITVLLNLPMLKDIIAYGYFNVVISFCRTYYLYGCIAAAFVQVALLLILYYHWGVYKFPSTLSMIACFYNFVVCVAFSVVVYILDLKDIYFTLQILFIIPVITIFLSYVFVLDDCIDLIRNRYMPEIKKPEDKKKKQKKEKPKKGELKFASNPNDDVLLNPNDVIHVNQKIISSAAEKAVPFSDNKKV